MCPSNELNKLIEHIMAQLNQGTGEVTQDILKANSKDNGKNGKNEKDKGKDNKNKNELSIPKLKPQKLLVILGLLGGALEVESISVDREQTIEILLAGSLRRKTRLDKMLDEIGAMPFDEVWKSLLRKG